MSEPQRSVLDKLMRIKAFLFVNVLLLFAGITTLIYVRKDANSGLIGVIQAVQPTFATHVKGLEVVSILAMCFAFIGTAFEYLNFKRPSFLYAFVLFGTGTFCCMSTYSGLTTSSTIGDWQATRFDNETSENIARSMFDLSYCLAANMKTCHEMSTEEVGARFFYPDEKMTAILSNYTSVFDMCQANVSSPNSQTVVVQLCSTCNISTALGSAGEDVDVLAWVDTEGSSQSTYEWCGLHLLDFFSDDFIATGPYLTGRTSILVAIDGAASAYTRLSVWIAITSMYLAIRTVRSRRRERKEAKPSSLEQPLAEV